MFGFGGSVVTLKKGGATKQKLFLILVQKAVTHSLFKYRRKQNLKRWLGDPLRMLPWHRHGYLTLWTACAQKTQTVYLLGSTKRVTPVPRMLPCHCSCLECVITVLLHPTGFLIEASERECSSFSYMLWKSTFM